jgi:hypothetical protein
VRRHGKRGPPWRAPVFTVFFTPKLVLLALLLSVNFQKCCGQGQPEQNCTPTDIEVQIVKSYIFMPQNMAVLKNGIEFHQKLNGNISFTLLNR